MFGINGHIDAAQGIADTGLDFIRRDAQVFRPKSHVFFDDGGDDLVIRILEDHAHVLAYLPDIVGVIGPHAADFTRAGRRRQEDIEMLGQRRLAGTVGPDDGDKFALADFQGNILQGIDHLAVFIFIGMAEMIRFNHKFCHTNSLVVHG